MLFSYVPKDLLYSKLARSVLFQGVEATMLQIILPTASAPPPATLTLLVNDILQNQGTLLSILLRILMTLRLLRL